jgi:hypothetical protein
MAQQSKVVGGKFSCAACGKQYAWKPQLAGKKAKCACGAAIVVPHATVAPPIPAPAPADYDLYDVAPPPAVVAPALTAPGLPAQHDTAAPRYPGAGKVGVVMRPADDAATAPRDTGGKRRDRSADIHDVRRDLLLPLGLIAAGFVGMLAWAVLAADAGAGGIVLVTLAAFVSTVVKTICIIALALIAAPMFGISFGDFRTAIAKFAAVIIFTDMALLWLSEIIEHVAGSSGGRAPRGSGIVTILLATALISFLVRFLFDMDSEETGYVALPLAIASLIIGFILKVLAVAVLEGLATAANNANTPVASATPATQVTSPAAVSPAPSNGIEASAIAADASAPAEGAAQEAAAVQRPAAAPAERPIQFEETDQDRTIARRLGTPAAKEARAYLANQVIADDSRGRLVDSLYAAGARHVYFDLTSGVPRPTRGYVELPAEQSRRAACVRMYQEYCRRNKLEPDPETIKDTAQRFLVIEMRR